MPKKKILFLKGINDSRKVTVIAIDKEGNYELAVDGSANLYKYLKTDSFESIELCLDTNRHQEMVLSNVHTIFNQISDADTHKITLSKAEDLQKQLAGKVPFFNAPALIKKTTRDRIYTLLQGIDKVHIPKTVKIQPLSPANIYDVIEKEAFVFPVIFRQAGDHGGISTIKVEDKEEQFHTFALDGRDYYLTQYVDYAKEGMYVKYRLAVVDGEAFLRHVMFSREWMIHDKVQIEDLEPRKAASERFLEEIKPFIQPTISEIHRRLELDYFGIDCHIDEKMNLLLFEVNANMNMFAKIENTVFIEHVKMMRQALIKMLFTRRNP